MKGEVLQRASSYDAFQTSRVRSAVTPAEAQYDSMSTTSHHDLQ